MKSDSFDSAHPGDAEEAAIDRTAAEWRTLHDEGMTSRQTEEFLRWLEADERHAEAFYEMDATWRLLARASEISPAALGMRPLLDPPVRAIRSTRRSWLVAPLAAAALIMLALALWRTPDHAGQHYTASVSADPGAFKRVNLPDGSVVRLNASSGIAVEFERRERRVRLLRGEAHFTVEKDPSRPFVVEAQGVAVRAVGTAFNVLTRTNAIEVLVTAGMVKVERASDSGSSFPSAARSGTGAEPVLGAGEKAIFPFASAVPSSVPFTPAVVRASDTEIEAAIAWHQRTLAFDASPLGEIVAEFNRYNRHQLVVDDAALRGRRFGGSFRADDPGGFVALLSAASGVAIERREHETVIRGAR